jgi:hypothetical protein
MMNKAIGVIVALGIVGGLTFALTRKAKTETPLTFGIITFSLINPHPAATKWALIPDVQVGSTEYFPFASSLKAPIGETLSLNWDDILMWIALPEFTGGKLFLVFTMRDETGYFLPDVPEKFARDLSMIKRGGYSYTFDWSTGALLPSAVTHEELRYGQ